MLFLVLSSLSSSGKYGITYKDLPIIFRDWSNADTPGFSRIIDYPNLDLTFQLD